MDPILALEVLLRIGTLTLRDQGKHEIADTLDRILLAKAAGRNIDEYMRTVADQLEAGTVASWADITARVERETDEFLSRGSSLDED